MMHVYIYYLFETILKVSNLATSFLNKIMFLKLFKFNLISLYLFD